MIGLCVCKRDMSGKRPLGYIGMLSVLPEYRGRGIGKNFGFSIMNSDCSGNPLYQQND